MLSIELLSEVLDLKRVDDIYIEDNTLYFCKLNKGINIYELAHKCKEWAKAYTLVSAYYFENGEEGAWCCLHKNLCSTDGETFHADNEPEAIFQACQWVLDNKEIK